MPSKISLMTAVLQADLDDTAALEVTNRLGQTRKSTIAQLRTAIVAGVLAAAHLTSPVIDSGGLTITSGTLGAQAVTATALTVTPGATSLQGLTAGATSVSSLAATSLTVTPGATSLQGLTAGATSVTTLAGTGAITGFTSLTLNGGVSGVTTLAGTGAVSGFTTANFSANVNAASFTLNGVTAVAGWYVAQNTKGLIIQSSAAANKVAITLDGANVWQFGDGLSATFNAGLSVSAGTTTTQALTAAAVMKTSGVVPVLTGTPTTIYTVSTTANGLYLITAHCDGAAVGGWVRVIVISGVPVIVGSDVTGAGSAFSLVGAAVKYAHTVGSTQNVQSFIQKISNDAT